jgi:methionyl-tRNA formyltransferase
LRIIFLGTPTFAVASLEAIINNGFNVVGVVTAPDKPAGRGMHLQQSPVKKFAVKNNLKVLQPVKLKDPEFIQQLKQLNADLQVVIAFRMLPEAVWNMPPLGTINLHASLLPDYRGAAPINWAIINGETETGVTTFFLKHEIDTGDILLQEKISIEPTTTAGQLHDKLMHLGAKVVVESLNKIQSGNYKTIPQIEGSNKIAPKIFTNTCELNFNKTTQQVYNQIRGLSPYPAAFTIINNKKVKIFYANPVRTNLNETPGKITTDNKTYLHIYCLDGYIEIIDLQPESKKRMDVKSFLAGNKIKS